MNAGDVFGLDGAGGGDSETISLALDSATTSADIGVHSFTSGETGYFQLYLDGVDVSNGFIAFDSSDAVLVSGGSAFTFSASYDGGAGAVEFDEIVMAGGVKNGSHASDYFITSVSYEGRGAFIGNADQLYGGAGDDKISGEGGKDWINGGEDDGDSGISTLLDESSTNFVGGDQLYGNSDLAVDGVTGDFIDDGAKDLFYFEAGDGVDTIHDFQLGEDQLIINGYTESEMNIFQDGNDTIISLGDGSEAIKLVGVDMGGTLTVDTYATDGTDATTGALSESDLIETQNEIFADNGSGGASSATDANIIIMNEIFIDDGGEPQPQ